MKMAIIGGAGKMGQWICRNVTDMGVDVIVADKDPKALDETRQLLKVTVTGDSVKAVKQARIILISVPINAFEQVVKEIGPAVRPGQIVIDVTSVKAKPVALMHKYIKSGLVLGVHPLFGPNLASLEGQNIVLTPTNEQEKAFALKVEKILRPLGVHITMMDPAAHDRTMAVVQGLSHFVAIAAADALSGLGELKEMKDVSTTTFRIFLNYIESVIGDDPELYAAIQMEHPEMADIYKKLTASVGKFSGLVETKDTRGFVKRMRELKKYLGK
jgi:prephenate dehydrogenase